jgi:hypothetical protein
MGAAAVEARLADALGAARSLAAPAGEGGNGGAGPPKEGRMSAFGSTLKRLYRQWRFVEEAESPSEGAKRTADPLRTALDREERRLAEYRRLGLAAMARDSEASLRALRNRLQALEMGG